MLTMHFKKKKNALKYSNQHFNRQHEYLDLQFLRITEVGVVSLSSLPCTYSHRSLYMGRPRARLLFHRLLQSLQFVQQEHRVNSWLSTSRQEEWKSRQQARYLSLKKSPCMLSPGVAVRHSAHRCGWVSVVHDHDDP